jgi:hypothetical protein
MILADRPNLSPHRCQVCGHTPPMDRSLPDARAPYIDTLVDDDAAVLRSRVYLCFGCIVEAVRLASPKTGMSLISNEERAKLKRHAADVEADMIIVKAENASLQDLLASLVDLPALARIAES